MTGVILALALNITANASYSAWTSSPPSGVGNVTLSDATNISVTWPDILATPPSVPEPPVYVFISVTLIYTLLFVLGVAGNLLVIVVVWRHPDMRSSTNCFIVNLSVADTLVIIVCMPTSLVELYSKNVWHLGPVMCKMVPFLENTVALSSVLTILAIGFERYHAICRPLLARYKCTFRHMLRIVLAIWVVACVACVPFLIITVHRDSAFIDGTPIKVCRISIRRPWQRVYILCVTAVFFVFPMAFLSALYAVISRQLMRDSKLATLRNDSNGLSTTRARKQVVVMLAAVVCLFFACLLPMNALRLWSLFRKNSDLQRLGFEAYLNVVYFARVFFYINSVINPVCYTMFSTKFREAFWRLTTRREALRNASYRHSSLGLRNSQRTSGTSLRGDFRPCERRSYSAGFHYKISWHKRDSEVCSDEDAMYKTDV